MKFSALPVHSFEDATLDLEQLQALLTVPGQPLPFLQLLSAQDLQIAVGTATVTFTASQTSAGTVVTHSLGRTPKAVLATPQQVVGATAIVPYVSVLTSSQFTLAAWVSVVVTTTTTCSWIAIG